MQIKEKRVNVRGKGADHRWCYLVTIIITHTHTHTPSLYIKKEKVFHAISATLPFAANESTSLLKLDLMAPIIF